MPAKYNLRKDQIVYCFRYQRHPYWSCHEADKDGFDQRFLFTIENAEDAMILAAEASQIGARIVLDRVRRKDNNSISRRIQY